MHDSSIQSGLFVVELSLPTSILVYAKRELFVAEFLHFAFIKMLQNSKN